MNSSLQTVNARLHFLYGDLTSINLFKSSYSIFIIKSKNEISKTFKYAISFVSNKSIDINKI